MKYNREDVELFKRWGHENPVISKLMKNDMFQPSISRTGVYSAPSWNWGYEFGLCKIGGKTYEVMLRFGSIVGGREIWLQSYTKTGKRVYS